MLVTVCQGTNTFSENGTFDSNNYTGSKDGQLH